MKMNACCKQRRKGRTKRRERLRIFYRRLSYLCPEVIFKAKEKEEQEEDKGLASSIAISVVRLFLRQRKKLEQSILFLIFCMFLTIRRILLSQRLGKFWNNAHWTCCWRWRYLKSSLRRQNILWQSTWLLCFLAATYFLLFAQIWKMERQNGISGGNAIENKKSCSDER